MGTFRTKLDFSNNRQVKQRIETTTVLSGGTSFGVTYSQLPSGPNYTLSAITQTIPPSSATTGTFSGNNTTTVFTWPINDLYLADNTFSAITPSNSASSQTSNFVFTADTSTMFTVDGNVGYGSYTGVGFTMFATSFVGLGGGSYSGTVNFTNVNYVEAPGLDYSGRTIWNDTSGITRTERLIITDNPQVGYVWTCIDSEGMGEWQYNGSSSGTTIWTAGTGANSAVLGGSGGIASGYTSVSEGTNTIAGGDYSHAEGVNTIASGIASHAEGLGDSTGYPTASGDGSHAEGYATTASGDYSHAEGNKTVASGTSSHAGGEYSKINSNYGFIHSYFSNIYLNSESSAILGGYLNTIDKSEKSGIFVGSNNTISGGTSGNTYNMILGGKNNEVYNHSYSTIINGSGNTIHFDILDFNNPNNFEMIENSVDSVISASTLSKISSSNSMTIANSIVSTVINSVASSFDPDPYITSGGIIGGTDDENGLNAIMNTYDGLIRYKASSNTIIGSTVARIDGTADGSGGANANFIGNSSSVTISDQYNTSGFSANNTIFGSYASSMRAPNIYSTIMGSSYVGMEYSDTSSIISSIDSEILTGITSSIIGGTGHTIATTESSIILGGNLNSLDTAYYSIIAGGSGNTITKNTDNLTQPKHSGIFAGKNNTIIPKFGSGVAVMSGSYCAIVGGESNTISGHSHSFIGGGFNNLIECDAAYNAIVAGQNNINHAFNGVIIGGQNNTLGFSTSCPSETENSIILGGSFHKIGESSNNTWNTAIIGGTSNLIDNTVGDVNNTVILGGSNITATTSNTVYAPNMIINTGGTESKLGINTSTPEYTIDARGTGNRLFYNNTGIGSVTLSATTGLPIIGVVVGTANTANQISGISIGARGWNDNIYTVYGYKGDAFIYAGIYTNGLNIISNDGTASSGADYIRFYAGQSGGGGGGNNPDLHIQGSGASRGFVAINVPYNQDPTERLDVNGNARFRNIGSSASAGALHYTSDGTLTTNTSDERLKTNIVTLTNALEKVKQLRGVKYNWTEEPNGDVRIGLIAQEVNNVVPELTFVNKNTEEQYMGVHYDNVVALLIEAVKELSSGITTSNNTHLETQTVLAEDNNIELNFNGIQQTAIGGGLTILHAKGQDQSADLITDADGNFVTNNDFKPQALTIPFYTPNSSNDVAGNEGNITRDDNYLYVKTSSGWKRTNLESF